MLSTLAPHGTWMIVEPYAGDRVEENLNPVGRAMGAGRKALLVLAGYGLAIVVAYVGVEIYIALTPYVDRVGESGMTAFGDSLVFLGLFGMASLPATGAALYFLRDVRAFWVVAAALAALFALDALAALWVILFPRATPPATWFDFLVDLSPIRALIAPLFAMAFLLAGVVARWRWARVTLLGAGAIEAAVFVCAMLHWMLSNAGR